MDMIIDIVNIIRKAYLVQGDIYLRFDDLRRARFWQAKSSIKPSIDITDTKQYKVIVKPLTLYALVVLSILKDCMS